MNEEGRPPRLLLIALDAVPPSLLKLMLDEGSLPNLRRLSEQARVGQVTSAADTFPGSVWPTFFTMSDVSAHGTYHLLQWDAARGNLRPPGQGWCEVTPFWHRLGAAGVPAIAMDVTFSDTGRSPENVREIIGWGMHEGVWASSRPRGLLSEMNRRHGRAEQVREGPGERPREDIAAELPGLVRDVRRRVAIIEDLASRFPWRFLLAVFSETHRAGHWFWTERSTGIPLEGVKKVMEAFDAELPRLTRLVGPQDQLAIFSLHGMAATGDIDRIGEGAAAYFDRAAGAARGPGLDPVQVLRERLPGGLVRLAARKMPQPLYNWTYRHLQNTRRHFSRLDAIINPLDHVIYAHANPQAQGAGGSPEAILARVRAEFEGMRSADGRPLIELMVRPAELYSGPRLHILPDLVIKPIEQQLGPEIVMADGERIRPPRHSSRDGDHVAQGFYMQAGPGVAAGAGPEVAGERLAAFLCQPAGLADALIER